MRAKTLSSIISLLFAIPLAAQVQPGPWAPKVKIVPGPPDPSFLIGEWSQSRMSGVDFVSPSGGHADPSGERYDVHFFSHGTYKDRLPAPGGALQLHHHHLWLPHRYLYVRGTDLEMLGKTSTQKSSDNCHQQYNYEKQLDPGHTVYQWHPARTKYGAALVMYAPSGEDRVYIREKDPLLSQK